MTGNEKDTMNDTARNCMRPELKGLFHIVNGTVKPCDGSCKGGEHWTTLGHAHHALSKGAGDSVGEVVIHHAPASAEAYRPEWNPDGKGGITAPSVVNRVFEVDRSSLDLGDLAFMDLWLALVDGDPHKIIDASMQVMDWSYGRVDGMEHPLVGFQGYLPVVNPKLQRLASDMYCSGWLGLQEQIEEKWIIPALSHGRPGSRDRTESLEIQLDNPLAYLEATRLAVVTARDALTGGAIQELHDTANGMLDPGLDPIGNVLVQDLRDVIRRPNLSYITDSFEDRVRPRRDDMFRILSKAIYRPPVEFEANSTPLAMSYGHGPSMDVTDVMEAILVEAAVSFNQLPPEGQVQAEDIVKDVLGPVPLRGISESYMAAAWKLARSVWSFPEGPEDDWDDPMDVDEPSEMRITNKTLLLALRWMMDVYADPQVRDWIMAIPADWLDAGRGIPFTGKLDRLHRLVHAVQQDDGTLKAAVMDDGSFNEGDRVQFLYRDMVSLKAPYLGSAVAGEVGPSRMWASANVY